MLDALAADDAESGSHGGIQEGLTQLGWVDGHNLQIETRWTRDNPDEFANTRRNSSRSPQT